MSNRSEVDFTLVKERIPYAGKGVDELVNSLRRILTLPVNRKTQKVVLEVGTPFIYIEKLVPTSEAPENLGNLTLHDAIRQQKLEEYEPEDDESTIQQLWSMFQMVQHEGFEVCFIAAGDKKAFEKWLGLRILRTDPRVFGTPFSIVGELPADTFVICGSSYRTAETDDIKYCVKGTL